MEADSPNHEKRIRKLEQRVPDLACELKIMAAELRAELATAIAKSKERMRAYVDARLAGFEQRLTARLIGLEQGLHLILGLLVAILLCMVGLASGMVTILSRLA